METLTKYTVGVCLMQCNTNYTGSTDNFDYVHLNVLKTYSSIYPEAILGLSDHTSGHASVLGAVALGARMIEKHFTDDNDRVGPDHPFAMNPEAWRDMVDRTRELERALGSSRKFIAENEQQTKYVQRRCVRANRDLEPGQVIRREDLDILRPFEMGAIRPSEILDLVGHKVAKRLAAGSKISWLDIVE